MTVNFVVVSALAETEVSPTRALSQNVTNAPEDALTPNFNNVEVTVQNKLHYCRNFSSQNSSRKINKEQ